MHDLDIPVYEADLFDEEGITQPYEHYRNIRNLGPVVKLENLDCIAVTRYKDAKAVLAQPDDFVSGRGVAINETMNSAIGGSIITTDGPRHDFLRKIELEPVGPRAIKELRERIFTAADVLISDLVGQRRTLDAVKDIAEYLPLSIVIELGGMPAAVRPKLLQWAAGVFNLEGPMNDRSCESLADVEEMFSYVANDIDASDVAPGSWAARAFRLADEGVIPYATVKDILFDFIAPSLDTTIAATGHLLNLLGQNPDQWEILKSDSTKIPNAINEAIRMETPVRCLSRFVATDTMIDDVKVPSGERVVVFYASANRDERKWTTPDRFDVTRTNANEHLGFGYGIHSCIGANLARLEMAAILTALVKRVDRLEVGEPNFMHNNLLRALKSLPIKLEPSDALSC